MKKLLTSLIVCLCLIPQLAFAELQYDTKEFTMDSKQGSFTAKYPFVSGVPAAAAINRQIQLLVSQEKQAIEKEWQTAPTEPLTREFDYEVTYGDNNLLSLNFSSSMQGGDDDRVLTLATGWTFDTINGQALRWQDLVDAKGKSAINKDALTLLLKKGARRNEYVLYDEFTKLMDIPDDYYLDNNGSIHFQFNPYLIGPYSSGVIDIDTGVITAYKGER